MDATTDATLATLEVRRQVWPRFWAHLGIATLVIGAVVGLALVWEPAAILTLVLFFVPLGQFFDSNRVGSARAGPRLIVREAPGTMPIGKARVLATTHGVTLESQRSGAKVMGALLVGVLASLGLTWWAMNVEAEGLFIAPVLWTVLVALRNQATPHRLVMPYPSIVEARRDGRVIAMDVVFGGALGTRHVKLRGSARQAVAVQQLLQRYGVEIGAGKPA